MSSRNLIELFNSLTPPAPNPGGRTVFVVRSVPTSPAARIGIDTLSRPAYIISVAVEDSQMPLVPFKLANIDVRHKVPIVLVDEAGKSETGVFSILSCPSQDADLQQLFIRCIGNALPRTSKPLSTLAVNSLVEHLINLFRLASTPPRGELLGLWAELLVITLCSNPKQMIQAWRPTEYTHYDFGSDTERIEVKATTAATRRHHISYEQANPPEGIPSWCISILTDEIGNGLSLRSLWEQCVNYAGSDMNLAEKVERNCLHTLGHDWLQGIARSFDAVAAKANLKIFDVSNIPRITDLPEGISSVRWVADFDRGTPIDVAHTHLTPIIKGLIKEL